MDLARLNNIHVSWKVCTSIVKELRRKCRAYISCKLTVFVSPLSSLFSNSCTSSVVLLASASGSSTVVLPSPNSLVIGSRPSSPVMSWRFLTALLLTRKLETEHDANTITKPISNSTSVTPLFFILHANFVTESWTIPRAHLVTYYCSHGMPNNKVLPRFRENCFPGPLATIWRKNFAVSKMMEIRNNIPRKGRARSARTTAVINIFELFSSAELKKTTVSSHCTLLQYSWFCYLSYAICFETERNARPKIWRASGCFHVFLYTVTIWVRVKIIYLIMFYHCIFCFWCRILLFIFFFWRGWADSSPRWSVASNSKTILHIFLQIENFVANKTNRFSDFENILQDFTEYFTVNKGSSLSGVSSSW